MSEKEELNEVQYSVTSVAIHLRCILPKSSPVGIRTRCPPSGCSADHIERIRTSRITG